MNIGQIDTNQDTGLIGEPGMAAVPVPDGATFATCCYVHETGAAGTAAFGFRRSPDGSHFEASNAATITTAASGAVYSDRFDVRGVAFVGNYLTTAQGAAGTGRLYITFDNDLE
ncbi:MAG: hypothetical protein KDA21_14695 [Phycisphaerales bacterium]|nr:hypothetical protein [Phycisphaerales bacterium]